ncbi:hypothetical protein Tco_0478316 [Tanacetum coccineum]
MTGNYLPSGPDIEVDDSQYTYGPEKTQPSESESQTIELDTCNSNISTEPSELVSEPVVNESNIEVQPKVWSDAPIIEEYELDSDDECVTEQTKGLDTPSFANKQVKTPRENVKHQSTHNQKPKVNNKELGHVTIVERVAWWCASVGGDGEDGCDGVGGCGGCSGGAVVVVVVMVMRMAAGGDDNEGVDDDDDDMMTRVVLW